MFSKTVLGLEIYSNGARFALLKGRRSALQLLETAETVFPENTIKASMKDLNIISPRDFVSGIRDTYIKLLTPVRRVAVSLPDSSGRTLITDIDVRLKSKEEGVSIIRWKLKKNFPFDINEVDIDFQVLDEREDGTTSVLVSCINHKVIQQYEELIAESGLEPNRIDFTIFNLYRPFEQRLTLAENAVFVIFYSSVLSILIFSNGILHFIRSKELPAGLKDNARIFREINNSLVTFNDNYANKVITEAFCLAPPQDEAAELCSIVAEIFRLEPVSLDIGRSVTCTNGFSIDKSTLYNATAAIGVAMRNI